MRSLFRSSFFCILVLSVAAFLWHPMLLWGWIIFGPFYAIGFQDYFQKKHSILRNFPVVGRFRYLFELLRPAIQQYFIENDQNGVPFNREKRSIVYQRAKKQLDTIPFGTKLDLYQPGYEWLNHSLLPQKVSADQLRISIGSPQCSKPYLASLLNISAMSFGALSNRAILALNRGAAEGGFAHNTGEGSISIWHKEYGGDLIWQIGTGYFGCRTLEGAFDPDLFTKNARRDQVKMIEIKLSQGAKPGHGGILPGAKVTAEIAKTRNVPEGKSVHSPPYHSAFSTPKELLNFVKNLRELSGGKPIGLKICIGKRREFLSLCKAIHETQIFPDYIAIDGAEGGTGAAPLEFSNNLGTPLKDALIFAHNALTGFAIRDKIRVIASGKITSSLEMITYLSIGADLCYAARSFMMAIGCIQALQCNSNHCPVGVATQDKTLIKGLVVENKYKRVTNYHHETLHSLAELIGAMGVKSAEELRPWHIMRRINQYATKHYGELYEYLKPGDLLKEKLPESYARACSLASVESFNAREDIQKVSYLG